MRPLAFLRCTARVAVNALGNAVGLGSPVALAREVLDEWGRAADAAARRADLAELVRMAAAEFRGQVEAVVREVAAARPPAVRERLATLLEQIPGLARQRFARPDDPAGRTVPPDFPLDSTADFAALLSVAPGPPPTAAAGVPWVAIRHTAGPLAGRRVVYTDPAVLLFGRAQGCNPQLPEHETSRPISRRHCFVEVNPPDVRVRDLGSRNGTFVGGHLIGKRPEGTAPAPGYESAEYDLTDGVEVRLADNGAVAFTVEAFAPPQPAVRVCGWCGRRVDGPGANRPGEVVCAGCRGRVGSVVRDAVALARTGAPDLTVLRDYELLEELGHGGMGAVHLARHTRTGESAAVKVMLPRVAASERAVGMFRREIRNTAALSHRNVVRCLDHGFAKGAFFLVLEYCDGGSVEALTAHRGGRLPADEAVEIALQALDGLHYAHTARLAAGGLVHRDVKPPNLFLSGRGSGRVVKVGDYGLAKAFEDSGLGGGTRTGDCFGTPRFMCRQQAIGYKAAGPEVDVWATAATLYHMLTGHAPRDFPPGRDVWLVVLEDPPVPILARNPALPPRLAELIDYALREEPEMPFRTAAEFKRALEADA